MNAHCDCWWWGVAGRTGYSKRRRSRRPGDPGRGLAPGRVLAGPPTPTDWLKDTTAWRRRKYAGSDPDDGTGYFDHNFLIGVERVTDHLGPSAPAHLPRQRLWRIRARQVVLATGAFERPLVFADNDRPGIMLAEAARTYLNRYAVCAGRRAVVVTNNDGAYEAALDLARRCRHRRRRRSRDRAAPGRRRARAG